MNQHLPFRAHLFLICALIALGGTGVLTFFSHDSSFLVWFLAVGVVLPGALIILTLVMLHHAPLPSHQPLTTEQQPSSSESNPVIPSETYYKEIFERAIEGIFCTYPDGSYFLVNPALARIYGYESPEELKQTLTNIAHQLYVDPQRRDVFVALMQKQGYVAGFESQVYRKDGTTIWIAEDAHCVCDIDGTLLFYQGFVRDITAQKEADIAIRHTEELQRNLLSAVPDTMLHVRRDGTILKCKPGIDSDEQIYGTPLNGQNFFQVLPAESAPIAEQTIASVIETGELRVFEYQRSDDTEMVDYEVRVIANHHDTVLALIRDVTQNKRRDRLKNEFVSIVSHELRTPLTSIRGSLGLIVGGVAGQLPPRVQQMIEIAYNNSERLVNLVNDILDIEKIESGQMIFHLKKQPLLPLLEQALEANKAYAEQYQVQFVLGENPPNVQVHADGNRILQVLTNLLSNAAKFSPKGDVVQITVSRHHDMVRVAISDNGPGIPEAFRPRIFQRFAQADSSDTRQKGGTGLGLSIARAIIEKHGGSISFETETGVGTTFFFELACVPERDVVSESDDHHPVYLSVKIPLISHACSVLS